VIAPPPQGPSWRLACCQYPITRLADLGAFRDKIDRLVGTAAGAGARLLVFPEYGAMELVSVLPGVAGDALARQLAAMQPLREGYDALFAAAAERHRVWIVQPSFPVETAPGRFVNRAVLVGPAGERGVQDKLTMTRFEAERWGVSAGHGSTVFATPLGGLAIAICYDIEIPTIARALAAAGADVILAPSCTDTVAGYHRVRLAARARALENQCYVAMSPTVGEASWSASVDVNVGAAGIFAPPERGFPPEGVLAEGVLNQPGWVYADIDLAGLHALRADPEVFLRRRWHAAEPDPVARVESL